MKVPSDDGRHPMAVAMEWVARIMAAAMLMVLPGLGGQWLDRRLSTQWIGLAGLALGLSVSIYYLLAVTRPRNGTGGHSANPPHSQ
jgi:hypothetical protein